MEQLNNLDVIFLIIIGISALVGIARGMTKEILSITGCKKNTVPVKQDDHKTDQSSGRCRFPLRREEKGGRPARIL